LRYLLLFWKLFAHVLIGLEGDFHFSLCLSITSAILRSFSSLVLLRRQAKNVASKANRPVTALLKTETNSCMVVCDA
jgi:hypothetical protein